MIHQGANSDGTEEAHTIELGRRSGTVIFTINTFSVPDELDVFYDGKLLSPSGCVGTSGFVCGDVVDLTGCNGIWCCTGGVCQQSITFSGQSTEMVVRVKPNCCGTVDTEWAFSISCPQ